MSATNAISFTGSLTVYNPTSMAAAVARSVTDLLFNQTGDMYVQGTMSIATSATVIPLGGVTNPHWAFFMNHDDTNNLTIRNGASGADLIQLFPGECAFVPLAVASVPYGLANTAACELEFMIFMR